MARTSLQGRIEVDPEPGAKRFQGVWLVPEDGPRLLIDYRADLLWRRFEGVAVTADIELFTPGPQEQAVDAQHARVMSLRARSEDASDLVEVAEVTTFEGRFELREGEPGSKRAEERWTTLVTGARELAVVNEITVALDTDLTVRARPVERSPVATHEPGEAIWVLDWSPEDPVS